MVPSWASQPPPHTQCANSGYVHPASTADDAQIAPSRQRSAAALSGIIAAIPTANICSTTDSDAGDPFISSPRRKNGCAAIQSQGFPPMVATCAARPAKPSHEKPMAVYTMAATDTTQSEASMACAALRDLPKPLLMSAIPATANGTMRIETRHKAVVISEI